MAGLNTADLEKRKHPDYEAYSNHYSLLLASYLGGQDYLNNAEEYIVQHPFEEDTMYETRVKLAYYLNYCRRVVETYTNFVFKETPKRTEDPRIKAWLQNVDGKGSDMDTFMKGVSSLSSVFGFVDVMLDAPQKTKATYTVADGQVVMTGSPRIQDGKNILKADVIRFSPNTSKIVCEPNATLIMYPDRKQRSDLKPF